MPIVPFEEFKKLDLRIALIVSAEKIEGSDKLLRLGIDLGDQQRQLVAGIGTVYAVEELVGRRIVVVVNLEPKTLMNEVSQGMLLAADTEQGPVLLMPERDIPAGSKIR